MFDDQKGGCWMKRTIVAICMFLSLVGLVFASGAVQPTPGGLVLADFEGFNETLDTVTGQKGTTVGDVAWWCYDDKEGGKSSTIRLEPVADAVQGEKAIKITYQLDGWTGGGASPISQDPKEYAAAWDWSQYANLVFYVKGNGSKQSFLIEFADQDGEAFRSPEQKINNTEWTKVVIPLKSFKSRTDWQPQVKVNRKFEWPCRSWQIVPLSTKGELSFDLFEVTP